MQENNNKGKQYNFVGILLRVPPRERRRRMSILSTPISRVEEKNNSLLNLKIQRRHSFPELFDSVNKVHENPSRHFETRWATRSDKRVPTWSHGKQVWKIPAEQNWTTQHIYMIISHCKTNRNENVLWAEHYLSNLVWLNGIPTFNLSWNPLNTYFPHRRPNLTNLIKPQSFSKFHVRN